MAEAGSLQETIKRIKQMEVYLDEVLEAIKNSDESLDLQILDTEKKEKLQMLIQYYESGQWLQDYECDERGELPSDLKRGILSQDLLYNLLCEIQEK